MVERSMSGSAWSEFKNDSALGAFSSICLAWSQREGVMLFVMRSLLYFDIVCEMVKLVLVVFTSQHWPLNVRL